MKHTLCNLKNFMLMFFFVSSVIYKHWCILGKTFHVREIENKFLFCDLLLAWLLPACLLLALLIALTKRF